jgi:hypothetical protein
LRHIALLVLTACGSPAPTVDLPPEWDALESAVGNGKVESATPDELHVSYESAPSDLADTWKAAIEAGGWTIGEPTGFPGLMSWDLTKGDQKLDLMISGRGSKADVLLTK